MLRKSCNQLFFCGDMGHHMGWDSMADVIIHPKHSSVRSDFTLTATLCTSVAGTDCTVEFREPSRTGFPFFAGFLHKALKYLLELAILTLNGPLVTWCPGPPCDRKDFKSIILIFYSVEKILGQFATELPGIIRVIYEGITEPGKYLFKLGGND
jgi:hypothetical protein